MINIVNYKKKGGGGMGKKLVFSVLCLASVAAFIAKADTLTLQQGLNGFSGFSDTYIVMTTDSTPNLSSELVVEGYHCSACIDERALMRIDLGSFNKNVTISKAELQLYSPPNLDPEAALSTPTTAPRFRNIRLPEMPVAA
jgi:hypothetical protein